MPGPSQASLTIQFRRDKISSHRLHPQGVPSLVTTPGIIPPEEVVPIKLPPKSPKANASTPLTVLHDAIATCERCQRLRSYCTSIGETRRKAYRDQTYWARPVPGFGDPNARILVLGLAPGAHGANRTGRPFTGDGSGDFMYPVLHELGLASKPSAVSRDDGLKLRKLWIGSVVRCAPPGDKPTPQEVRNCGAHLTAELAALPKVRVVVCLGKIAWDGYLAHLLGQGIIARRSAFPFTHAAEYRLPNGITLLGSYHPSLRNTNTGRLNRPMFAHIFVRALELAA
jgi:uracil-DNA glycosylase family 4